MRMVVIIVPCPNHHNLAFYLTLSHDETSRNEVKFTLQLQLHLTSVYVQTTSTWLFVWKTLEYLRWRSTVAIRKGEQKCTSHETLIDHPTHTISLNCKFSRLSITKQLQIIIWHTMRILMSTLTSNMNWLVLKLPWSNWFILVRIKSALHLQE